MSKLHDKIGSFTIIPNSVVKLWSVIGLDAMGLFVYMRYRTNTQTGDAFPGYDLIQKETGIGRRRIAKAIRVLELHHLLERKKRFGKSTIYTLTLPRVSNKVLLIEPPISNTLRLSLVTPCASNYIEVTKEKISPDGDAIESQPQADRFPMMELLADITGESLKLNAGKLGKAAKKLEGAGYTAEQVKAIYQGDKSWWKTQDWRGKQGQQPNIASINETIKRATAGKPKLVVR